MNNITPFLSRNSTCATVVWLRDDNRLPRTPDAEFYAAIAPVVATPVDADRSLDMPEAPAFLHASGTR